MLLSVKMLVNTSYLQMKFFHTNSWATTTVIFGTGSVSIHLEKYSTSTKAKQRLPFAAGNGPMMSRPYLAKGQIGGRGYNGTADAFVFWPAHWHLCQRWTRSCALRNAVG